MEYFPRNFEFSPLFLLDWVRKSSMPLSLPVRKGERWRYCLIEPFSLLACVYKLLAEVLASHLRSESLIVEAQNALIRI